MAGGWLSALFAAASYAVSFALGRLFQELPDDPGGSSLASAEIADLCAVAGGVVLAWCIGRRASRLAAAIVLAWILAAAAMKIVEAGAPAAVAGAILALAALNGLRASLAQHRLAPAAGPGA